MTTSQLNHMQLDALQYVKNTGGCAEQVHFISDHDPIGPMLWNALVAAGAIATNENKKIIVTAAGEKLLAEGVSR